MSPVRRIDGRSRKAFYQYEVRTNDNVNLRLQGTIFWRGVDVPKLLNVTADPAGDVWYRARSALISAVSRVPLSVFMTSFNNLVLEAFDGLRVDDFFTQR